MPEWVGDALWLAWLSIERLEDLAVNRGGVRLPHDVLALWALARFGGANGEADILGDLLDDEFHPRFSDWLLEDVTRFAFALGMGCRASADLVGGRLSLVADDREEGGRE